MQRSWSGGEVARVLPGTPAYEAGLRPGDVVLEVNGERPRDQLEFMYLAGDGPCRVKIRSSEGSVRFLDFGPGEEAGRGLEFSRFVFDGIRTCRNRCVFCFVRQLPQGLRPSLYLRDDDYRLSMIWGNFVTLTNLEEDDWRRIEVQKISPLRVSVHALDPDVRARLMGNPRAGLIEEDLDRLVAAGITVHAQVVLLRGVNDGEVLDRTLEGLFRRWPWVRSCGVVPAVYTRWRSCRPSLPRDAGWSHAVLDRIRDFSRDCLARVGYPFVWAADEFYLMAGESPPVAGWYRDFPQYENGIGIVADFRREARAWSIRNGRPVGRGPAPAGAPEFLVVTGEMAAPELRRVVRAYVDPEEARVKVVAVPNGFFGEEVQAAGLLTGQDIAVTLLRMDRERKIRLDAVKAVLLPDVCLKEGEEVFLDDFSVRDLREVLGVEVRVLEARASSLLEFFQGEGCVQGETQDRGHSRKTQCGKISAL